jgi:hypothetical protein
MEIIYVREWTAHRVSGGFNARDGEHFLYVDEKMHEWYYIWDRNPYKFHKEKYYSLCLKTMAWINGRAHSEQVEAVKPEETGKMVGPVGAVHNV